MQMTMLQDGRGSGKIKSVQELQGAPRQMQYGRLPYSPLIFPHAHRAIDETRPNCKRCLKAKLTCGDWPSLTVIQFQGRPIKRQRHTLKLKQETPMAEDKSLSATRFLDLSSPWSKVMIPPDDIFVNYTLAHLLKSSDQMDQIAIPGVERALADQCFLALATSYFGNEHREQALVKRGFQRYSSALEGLHEALGDVSKSKTYDVLESVIVMALFEVFLFLGLLQFQY